MKPEDIKRIAEIIEVDCNVAHDNRVFLKALYSDVYDDAFRPDTNWAHTGMLLEWLEGYCYGNRYEMLLLPCQIEIGHYVSYCDECDEWELVILTEPRETLQLAICNAVLSLGEEE